MYIGSDGPRRLLNITPTQPLSGEPALDLLTHYLVHVLGTATAGLVIAEAGYHEFKPGATAAEQTCACGVTAPEFEYYVQDPGLYGHILPSLTLHYLVWHRAEVPGHHLRLLRQAATDSFMSSIGQRPPALAVQRDEAITIVRKTQEYLHLQGNPAKLTAALATALTEVGYQQVGWRHTCPLQDATTAIVAAYAKLHPDIDTDCVDSTALAHIGEWAAQPNRSLAEVKRILKGAIQHLSNP
ncbi:MAG TPA: hypothetical protein VMT30_08275 [Candidatus Saccharimonadia bacterium]|nr:hypothetical protein [Candidatus Saccharimonadia bacterium]